MYGEKILDSAAEGMKQLFTLFLLKIRNLFYSCLETWIVFYGKISKCIMTDLLLASVLMKTTSIVFAIYIW